MDGIGTIVSSMRNMSLGIAGRSDSVTVHPSNYLAIRDRLQESERVTLAALHAMPLREKAVLPTLGAPTGQPPRLSLLDEDDPADGKGCARPTRHDVPLETEDGSEVYRAQIEAQVKMEMERQFQVRIAEAVRRATTDGKRIAWEEASRGVQAQLAQLQASLDTASAKLRRQASLLSVRQLHNEKLQEKLRILRIEADEAKSVLHQYETVNLEEILRERDAYRSEREVLYERAYRCCKPPSLGGTQSSDPSSPPPRVDSALESPSPNGLASPSSSPDYPTTDKTGTSAADDPLQCRMLRSMTQQLKAAVRENEEWKRRCKQQRKHAKDLERLLETLNCLLLQQADDSLHSQALCK